MSQGMYKRSQKFLIYFYSSVSLSTFFNLAKEFSFGNFEDETWDKELEELGMASWNQVTWNMLSPDYS